ncbi:MAG: glycosyltransferase family 2 protein [Bacteroidaceae bacterium]|nr:glycosyltransferase family 2 protein [Bacteroidaceae bacterium]
MDLSILIPAYNQSCLQLVRSLQQQCLAAGASYEIIVADDASTDEAARRENAAAGELEGCRAIMQPQNRGRAATRNLLVSQAGGDYLLFIDSDALLTRPDFIATYLAALPTRAVICGGIVHADELPGADVSLRWRYEKACEPLFTARRRSLRPYQCLRTFNIMLPRAVALAHPFDERLRHYGYEDTLMGRELEQAGIEVRHIDNPMLNHDLEDNATFLEKTRESMRTLLSTETEMQGYSSLLRAHRRLSRLRLTRPLAALYRLGHRWAERNLLGPRPSVRLLQLYKLCYYCEIKRQGRNV